MTTEEFIRNVRRQASIPISQVTFQTTDFIEMMNAEMQTFLLPWIDRIREEFFLQNDDQVYSVGGKYRIHYRASGCTLRDVKLVIDGAEFSPNQVAFDNSEDRYAGYYIRGQHVHIIEPISAPNLVRLVYMVRPNRNVVAGAATTIASKTATTITLASTPSVFSSPIAFDVIRNKEPYDFPDKGFDRAGTLAAGVITVTDGNGTTDFSTGDIVALAGQSPVVMLPEPAALLLAQQVALRCLEALGDADGVQLALQSRGTMAKEVAHLLSNRVKGDPKQIVTHPSNPLWRAD